jgi:Tfp pilus assembly protein PilX
MGRGGETPSQRRQSRKEQERQSAENAAQSLLKFAEHSDTDSNQKT